MAQRRRGNEDSATEMKRQKERRQRWHDEDGQRRRRDGASATKIATTKATTWLNHGAESIGTLNLGFRVKGKNSLSFLIWEGTREFTQRRMCYNLRRS